MQKLSHGIARFPFRSRYTEYWEGGTMKEKISGFFDRLQSLRLFNEGCPYASRGCPTDRDTPTLEDRIKACHDYMGGRYEPLTQKIRRTPREVVVTSWEVLPWIFEFVDQEVMSLLSEFSHGNISPATIQEYAEDGHPLAAGQLISHANRPTILWIALWRLLKDPDARKQLIAMGEKKFSNTEKINGNPIASIDDIDRIEEINQSLVFKMYFNNGHKPLELNPKTVPYCFRQKATERWHTFLTAVVGTNLNRSEKFRVNQSLRKMLENKSLDFFNKDTFKFVVKRTRKDSYAKQTTRNIDEQNREAEGNSWEGKNTFEEND